MSEDTSRRLPSVFKGVASGRTESAAGRGSLTGWRTIAIARDRRRVWPGWLGWNAPTLTHRARTRPVKPPCSLGRA
jgi:hypothetical protein